MKKMDQHKVLFSVIIPVYNVEKYLKECLDSILCTNYKKFEVVLVDDGSTDTSSDICDEYKEKYNNIVVIHKNNGGLSDARNVGVDYSSGKYIVFVDSDDFIERNFFHKAEIIISGLDESVDLVVFGYKKLFSDGKMKTIKFPECNHEILNMVELYETGWFITSAWGKIVKAKLIKNNNISFRRGVTAEDIEWCAHLMLCCHNVYVWHEMAYIYRQRTGSISKNVNLKTVVDVRDAIERCIIMEKSETPIVLRGVFRQYIARTVAMYVIDIALLNRKLWRDEIAKSEELLEYLREGTGIREKSIYIASKIVGIENVIRVLRLYMMLRGNY